MLLQRLPTVPLSEKEIMRKKQRSQRAFSVSRAHASYTAPTESHKRQKSGSQTKFILSLVEENRTELEVISFPIYNYYIYKILVK